MLKLIKYFEAIKQHYNINKDNFLIRGKLEDLDIFDEIDTLYVFIKSFDEINDILKKNNVNKKITFKVIKNNVNKNISLLFSDFLNKKIHVNQLKQGIVDLNNNFNIKVQDYNNLIIGLYLNNKKADSFNFNNSNFKTFFNQYHEYLFHLLSDPSVLYKFNKKKYGDFFKPEKYSASQILKELFSSQTNPIAFFDVDDNPINFGEIGNDYSLFEMIRYHLEQQNKLPNWKNFRDKFKDYPKILKLFPKEKYPDNYYFIEPDDNSIPFKIGDQNKILMAHQVIGDLFQGKKDKIKNFENEIAYVIKKSTDLIEKISSRSNDKYLKQLNQN